MRISVLFPTGEQPTLGIRSEATADLRLDQVIDTIAASRAEYEITPFLLTPLTSAEDVRFRQAIFRDVEAPQTLATLEEFADGMRGVRRRLTGLTKLHSRRQQQAWLLEAAAQYCRTIDALTAGLRDADINSAGLRAVRDFTATMTDAPAYGRLRSNTTTVLSVLRSIRYSLTVAANRVVVGRYEGESDYSQRVLDSFERFRQREVTDAISLPTVSTYMNHVDAQVLDRVARLYPDEFAALDQFCDTHHDFVDETLMRFDREINFYLATGEFMHRLRSSGLPICLPDITADRTIEAHDIYDVALADKLIRERRKVVLNDLELREGESIIVVTGPNQGGKTTFARSVGQLHYLASLGCPTPGTDVRVGLPDGIYTQFERTEDLRTLSGKLEDELVRLRQMLEHATDDSIVVMNESFGSTSLRDATLLGGTVLRQLIEREIRTVYVTFVDELSRLAPSVVSMVSKVADDDPSARTYKIVRRRADGRAYAASLAEQHGLTADQIKARVGA